MIKYTYVGIFCSVVGNVLISLALNIQKYAHTKLSEGHNLGREQVLEQDSEQDSEPGAESGRVPRLDEVTEQSSVSSFQTAAAGPEVPVVVTDYGYCNVPSGTETEQSSPNNTFVSDKQPIQQHNYLSSPYWWLGAIVMSVGEGGNFIAYGFAPVSIVSPLGVVTIISNCTIAPLIFKEPLRVRDVLGTFFATCGVLLVVASSISSDTGNDDQKRNALAYITSVLKSAHYIYYVMACLCLVFISVPQLRILEHRIETCGLASVTSYVQNLYTMGNIFVVAVFGAHTAIATKCLSTLLEFSPNVWDLLLEWQFYYLVFVLVITAVFQIKYLNKSLKIEKSTKVIPIHFVFFTISVLVGSDIVFQDSKNKTNAQIALFIVGCCLTFVSVFLIAGGTVEEKPAESSENDIFVTVDNTFPNETQFYSAHPAYKPSLISLNSNVLTESLMRKSLNVDILSRSTSIGHIDLEVPHDTNNTSRSLPMESNVPAAPRTISRSKSFITSPNNGLLVLPGTGTVTLNHVLTTITKDRNI